MRGSYVRAFYLFKAQIHSVLECESIFLKFNLFYLSEQERVFRFEHPYCYHVRYVYV